jgi:hypothetical protein
MKFNLKMIAAAVAMAAASVPAMAKIQNMEAVGGSELVFYAFDATAGTSYYKDLGVTFDSFIAAPTFGLPGSNNIGGDANWTQYATSVGNDFGGTVWGVMGGKKVSGSGAGSMQFLTTATLDAASNSTSTSTNANLTSINTSFNTNFLTLVIDGSSIATNNSYFTSAAVTDQSNWSVGGKDTGFGKLSAFTTGNAIGTDASFFNLVRSSSTNGQKYSIATVLPQATPNDYKWSFDGSTLVAAPVPEPETYGLMLAGLAVIGAIARRRRQVA